MTEWQKIIATGCVSLVGASVGQPTVRGLGKGAVASWRWLTRMPNFERRRPYWLYRFRCWWNSIPERRLNLLQRFHWYVGCRFFGHHFPRGLENNAGYWNIRGEHWFGVCEKCTGMVERDTQAKLDECERRGAAPNPINRTTRPKRQLAV